jgi:hypothetical protein
VAVTPDAQRALSGSGDTTLRVSDLSTGPPVATLQGHSPWVTAVAVTSDGRRGLGTVNAPGLEQYSHCARCDAGRAPGGVAMRRSHAEGLGLLHGPGGDDAPEPQRLGLGSSRDAGRARALSGSGDKTLKVWGVATGQAVATRQGHSEPGTAVAVTRMGATPYRDRRTTRLGSGILRRTIRSQVSLRRRGYCGGGHHWPSLRSGRGEQCDAFPRSDRKKSTDPLAPIR